jgi:DNA ligase 1
MQLFTELFSQLDQTTKTKKKLESLKVYFAKAPDQDKLWALALFTGKRPRKAVNSRLLWQWTAEKASLPAWLFEECYHVVGDMAETVALTLPKTSSTSDKTLEYWIKYLSVLPDLSEEARKEKINNAWDQMTSQEQFVFTKLITGSFRIGVSSNLVVQAIADLYDLDKAVVTHRIMGKWEPAQTTFDQLLFSEDSKDDTSRPYPFFLAYALDKNAEELGEPSDWQAEWKWDGIRGQIIYRKEELYVWSRGEDLLTEKFPEFFSLTDSLPEGTVIDGEILAFENGNPLPFSVLQTRIGRKNVTKNILKSAPVVFMAYDIMEWKGEDFRYQPLETRRKVLEELIAQIDNPVLILSPILSFETWEELAHQRERSREYFSEGLMLKRRLSAYQTGRKRGDWWKWKVEPLTIDGVLLYAQKGHGRRADLYTDYSFAVWEGDQLIPFAKAYSGLTDKEIAQVDRFVKRNTKEKFGPVRTVKTELVFEIAFEGIQESKRHKSGIAVRFPRIHRWRKDKKVQEANTLDDLKQLLNVYGTETKNR